MKTHQERFAPKYQLDVVEGLKEYKQYQKQHGDTSLTSVLSQALVHKGSMGAHDYSEHLINRMIEGENLKFFLLRKNETVVAAAMGWRRGSIINSPRIQMQSIAVDKTMRGYGLFNKLIDSVTEWMEEKQYKGMDIEVGINSMIKNTDLYLHAGCNPNEMLFALDVKEKSGKPSFAAREAQKNSVDTLKNIFDGITMRAKL